jgi:hypothetical protein
MAEQWSVGIETEGDRVISRAEVVELADAVAGLNGIASGVGTAGYGARIVVTAGSRDEAVELATGHFAAAVRTAGLPEFPVVRVDAVSESEAEADTTDY